LGLSSDPAPFRDALTALGSGGAGASLTDLRLESYRYDRTRLALEGVKMLPGALPRLRALCISAECFDFSSESVRSLLLAPGALLATLELKVTGAAGHTLDAIADEVSRAGLTWNRRWW
jgi:hypothetical protein